MSLPIGLRGLSGHDPGLLNKANISPRNEAFDYDCTGDTCLPQPIPSHRPPALTAAIADIMSSTFCRRREGAIVRLNRPQALPSLKNIDGAKPNVLPARTNWCWNDTHTDDANTRGMR